MSLPQETLSLLQNVPLFVGLPNKLLDRHLGHSRRLIAEGKTLRSLSDPGEHIYIILSGCLRANQGNTSDGSIPMFRTGESVSEISLQDGDNAFDRLVADTDSELLCVDLATLLALADDSPLAARNMLDTLSSGITLGKRSNHDSENQQGYTGLNYVDELTGLYNSQWMQQAFERQIQRSVKNRGHAVLMTVGIDQYERYSQSHGSLGGDQALRTIAQTILTCLRPNDQAVHHYGGVFAIFMPHTTLDEARMATRRLLSQAGQAEIVTPSGDALPHVTLSVGLAEVLEGKTLQQLLDQAIEAMQREKQSA